MRRGIAKTPRRDAKASMNKAREGFLFRYQQMAFWRLGDPSESQQRPSARVVARFSMSSEATAPPKAQPPRREDHLAGARSSFASPRRHASLSLQLQVVPDQIALSLAQRDEANHS